MLNMRDTISRDVKQLKNSYQFIRQEFQELRSISNNESLVREKRALLPIVGKALSFLFDTLDEDDLTVIRNNIQTLANNQIKIKHLIKNSLTITEATQRYTKNKIGILLIK